MITSCNQTTTEKEQEKVSTIIGKKELSLKSDLMTPEVLWSFGRVSGAEISPDQSKVLYGTSYYSVPENKGNRELFVMNIDGSNVQQLTKTPGGEYNAVWKPDGSKIAFLSGHSGSMQMWEMDTNGKNSVQISDIDGGISGFKYAPDMSKIVYSKEVKLDETVHDLYPDLQKANAKIATDLMYRHWD
ncbi:MAG: peptidase S9, partial [Bacteroidetes bacterium]